jgi:plastocyanin
MRRGWIVLVLALVSTAAALGVAQAARSDSAGLTAISGTNDSYTISFTDASGAVVSHLAPGTFSIAVHDGSIIHNFHLVGPGVDKATSVLGTGDFTWSATVANGYYRFLCDPHVASMHGDFTVGSGRRPLTGSVSPTRKVALRDAFGLTVREIVSDRYVVTVKDRSTKDNFRLRGPGVNRATGLAFRGTARWPLTLKDGVYTVSSDARKSVRRTIRVTGPPVWGT